MGETDPLQISGSRRRRTIHDRTRSTGLPLDSVELVGRRLSLAALLYSLVFIVGWGAGWLIAEIFGGEERWVVALREIHPVELVDRFISLRFIADVVVTTCIVAGLLVFWLVRRYPPSPNVAIRLALLLLVLSCLGISTAENWAPPPRYATGVSWLCLWIAIYPMLVPLPPRRALIAALIAASTGPPAYLLASHMIGFDADLMYLTWRFFPNYIAALTAWVASRFIYRLSKDAVQARQMGSYTLMERIGKGGMGEVWKAQHRLLARPAAVKLIQPESWVASDANAVSTMLRRFEREARATAALRSNYTVEIYDYGISHDGVFYYVMELLDGIDLESLVAEHGPQSPERVSYILQRVCLSLEEAHRVGIIHRDIKPANIVLCRKGIEYDCVKVLDFGLVKAMAKADQFTSKLTVDGMTYGTPAYMSPEAAQALPSVDYKSDVYALACVGYWLLTGEMVFERANPMQILIAHVNEQPVPPSQLTATAIPSELEAIILQSLAKDPADRPASCRVIADALDSLASAWTTKQAETWWKSHAPEHIGKQSEHAEAETANTIPTPRVQDTG
ncbi:MAG: serine/threonine protein kinase [Proteobacteria bacterium]|nr:serine/threonine protein kinase [Pseudomonadota bacterium]